MASSQALGSALKSYNPFIAPNVQAKLLQAQQQQALAQALIEQGMKPDDKEHQIGGVAYAVSPLEGLGKLAQQLSGRYQLDKSNEDYVNAFQQPAADGSSGSGGSALSSAGQGILSGFPSGVQPLVQAALMNGEYGPALTAAGAFMGPDAYWKAHPGAAKAQEAMGTAAAGNMPAGTMPDGLQPPIGGAQLPPIPPVPPQISADQIDNVAASQMPPMASGSLSQNAPPNQAMGASVNPPPNPMSVPAAFNATSMPSPMPGESQNQYMARLDAAKAGATSQSQGLGSTTAEIQKTYDLMGANLPIALDRFHEMSGAAKDASYGMFVDPQTGSGLMPGIHSALGDKTDRANAVLQQRAAQGVLPELGPQLASSGVKGNKFLETLSSNASGLDMSKGPQAKQAIVMGLRKQYINNMVSAHDQLVALGHDPGPIPDLIRIEQELMRRGQ